MTITINQRLTVLETEMKYIKNMLWIILLVMGANLGVNII